uniref:Flocculation protein FLO11-like isoform X3 n=1 Tax=Crassostrea virginica TaxID=6565 RepID=A0A8B8BM62_CRAVI|nr:flocculation protein FLO11-like isoform X3 [Crassostrea virginica]
MLSTHPGVRWFIISWFVTALETQNLFFCENEDPCVSANAKTPFEPEARFSNCGITNTLCDRYIPPGWYRYNDRMLDRCPSIGSCGSVYPNWLNGSHPVGVNSEVERIVCKVGFSGCCEQQYKIKIRNCGLYMAYCLPALDTCPERYCFGETGSCVLTNSFSTTEAITERTPTTTESIMEQTTERTPTTDLSTTETFTEHKPTTSQSTTEPITERTPTTNPSTTEQITERTSTTYPSTREPITERSPTTSQSTTEPITERIPLTSQSTMEPITELTPTTSQSTTKPITERTPTTSQSATEPITGPTPTTNQRTDEPITERTSLTSKSTTGPITERNSMAYSTRPTVTVSSNITELSSTSPSTSTSTSETENIATSSTEPSTTDITTSTKKPFIQTTKATTISVNSAEGNAISTKPHETTPSSPTSSLSDTTSPLQTTRMSELTSTARSNAETTTTSRNTAWVTSAKDGDAITGESSLGVMPVVAIVTGACVLVVVVISATIYKMRQTDRQPEANRKDPLSLHVRQQVPQREDHEYDEIESVFEDDKSSIHDDSYAAVEPVRSRDDSQRNVYENGTFFRDSHPTPCDNTSVHNSASTEPVYDSIIYTYK